MVTLTEFQVKKMERVFTTFFDTNNDGIIEWDDFVLAVEKVKDMNGWEDSSSTYTKAKDTMKMIWEGLKIFADHDKDGKITREEWCEMWGDYNRKKAANISIPDWQIQYMNFMFDVNDASGDGAIDKDEYTAVYTHFGLTPDECSVAFDRFAPDGTVDRDTFSTLWSEYFTSADPQDKGNFIFGCL